jgi:hypothetical protein
VASTDRAEAAAGEVSRLTSIVEFGHFGFHGSTISICWHVGIRVEGGDCATSRLLILRAGPAVTLDAFAGPLAGLVPLIHQN